MTKERRLQPKAAQPKNECSTNYRLGTPLKGDEQSDYRTLAAEHDGIVSNLEDRIKELENLCKVKDECYDLISNEHIKDSDFQALKDRCKKLERICSEKQEEIEKLADTLHRTEKENIRLTKLCRLNGQLELKRVREDEPKLRDKIRLEAKQEVFADVEEEFCTFSTDFSKLNKLKLKHLKAERKGDKE